MILYVDDEKPNRLVFEKSFGARFKIRTMASPTEALALLRVEPFGVLITDQRMPEMTGNELLAHVKRERPDVVRIIITAYGDLDQILTAVNDGLVARYIIKPWDRAELEQILTWAVEEHRTIRRNAMARRQVEQEERRRTTADVARLLAGDLRDPALAGRLSAFLEAQPPPEVGADPRDAAHDALAMCRAEAPEARVGLSYDGPAELPGVAIGRTPLVRVLVALLDNAIAAVSARPETNGNVLVQATVGPERVVLSVRDDGPGIPPEIQASVGTPFFTTAPGAAGLGLALARRSVEQVGGSLTITSSPEGTRVDVSLPLRAGGEVGPREGSP